MSNMGTKTIVAPTIACTTVSSKQRRSNRVFSTKSHNRTNPIRALNEQVKKIEKPASRQRKLNRTIRPQSRVARQGRGITTRLTISQAQRRSSSGSSDPTGVSASGSSESARSSQDKGGPGPQSLPRSYQPYSDLRNVLEDNRVTKPISSSARKPVRQKPVTRIVIGSTFTHVHVPHTQRSIQIVVEENDSVPTSPQTESDQEKNQSQSDTAPSIDRLTREERKTPMLSPRSLRRARLKLFDRARKLSSLSSVSLESLFAGDRRGSTFLPRQHRCESVIRGHHDAHAHQETGNGLCTKSRGSPDPESPHPGVDLEFPDQEKDKLPRPAQFKIVNMGVTDILHAVTDKSYAIELVAESTIYKLGLDNATRTTFDRIANHRHGNTVTGLGPWSRIDSCSNRLDWHSWCYLYSMSETTQNGRSSFARHTRSFSGDDAFHAKSPQSVAILVPLTRSQAELLHERLRVLDRRRSDA